MYKQKLPIIFLLLLFTLNLQIFASIEKHEKKSFDVDFGGQLIC